MNKTTIQWTERTWNPMHGCTKHSAGCAHCYAEVMARRLQGAGAKSYDRGFMPTLNPDALDEPKRIKKPSMFFVCSMGDLFHKDVPFEYIDKVMATIEATPQHTYQILTKRAHLMHQYFLLKGYIPQNVWVGVSVEDVKAKERMWYLKDLKETCCAPVTFLSCEPLLGDLDALDLSGIDWVIVGGESGPQARLILQEWVFNIKTQCNKQNVPFFFKQWGTWSEDGEKRNKKVNGNLLNGQLYQEWPKAWKGGNNG